MVEFIPIGKVVSFSGRREDISEIQIFVEYEEGLKGIEEFSHLILIYLLDKSKFSGLTKERKGVRVGVFATRSPNRPNPIGLSVVNLVERKGNTLLVTGSNAFKDTPILDIKPYDRWDSIREIRVPSWHNVQ
ncbi:MULTISPECIES: tRNA (N6-threonylcarbamoyladenosine(37)-N6)-methyltransferase TrmO [Acidianus]|uniref:Methyltransferase n=1 Tax=Candidatus Acidianus copahuensis TaxID=1160895 RepID=A0A031LIQ4_9CREN|nr:MULTISPECIES: tRNA (N6-threonylcarbamoyladenosine(37)-N6)-methyltransferase TrmO [Acidianus]EZQ02017.1 methyltransferase [Candidatus Acidianus copahuensis]NON61524.1 tRNA (N6-threonylcarbamoyladenosine(37)-N6)-methyltransferase TrmO [Acidianus sp. RZ1]